MFSSGLYSILFCVFFFDSLHMQLNVKSRIRYKLCLCSLKSSKHLSFIRMWKCAKEKNKNKKKIGKDDTERKIILINGNFVDFASYTIKLSKTKDTKTKQKSIGLYYFYPCQQMYELSFTDSKFFSPSILINFILKFIR